MPGFALIVKAIHRTWDGSKMGWAEPEAKPNM
jgi:hypothetical protein